MAQPSKGEFIILVNWASSCRWGSPRRCCHRGGQLHCHFDPPSWFSEAPIRVLVSLSLLQLGERGGEFWLVAGCEIHRRFSEDSEAGSWRDYGSANPAEEALGEAHPLALRQLMSITTAVVVIVTGGQGLGPSKLGNSRRWATLARESHLFQRLARSCSPWAAPKATKVLMHTSHFSSL